MRRLVVLSLALALASLSWLSYEASAAPAGCVILEPIPGLPVLPIQVENECPDPDPAPGCSGFLWYGECWTRGEGAKFAAALRAHGVSPKAWKRAHPALASTFGPRWPR